MIITSESLAKREETLTFSLFFKLLFPNATLISPVSWNIDVGTGESSCFKTSFKSIFRDLESKHMRIDKASIKYIFVSNFYTLLRSIHRNHFIADATIESLW
ncbi:hypothetical protein E2C01_090499 [Portunus trituberculatus]|uniref:Uncharacterized protein n=1 Tax=Portunus trituberculatus TaxID=210409 RepID=A0A5B7JLY7_PORTR|nr:hypothetical protein [Portunus trituberculatus]